MFSSLRSRLLLSYFIIIGVTLSVVATVTVIYLARNPSETRQARLRLQTAAETIVKRAGDFQLDEIGTLRAAIDRADEAFDVRVLLLDGNNRIMVDSRLDTDPALLLDPTQWEDQRVLIDKRVDDEDGNQWMYLARSISGNRWVIVATIKPNLTILAALRSRSDEIIQILRQGGLAALILSLLFAFGLSRWIASPLQRITQAARSVAAGNYQSIRPEGPKEVKSLVLTFNEMTDQVQTMQQSQRDFVANVSHELKTPLTSIQGFAQAIMDGTVKSRGELDNAARVIHSEAERMHALVLDLLDLARLDAKTVQFERSPVNLPALLESVIAKLTPQTVDAQVDITLQVEEVASLIADGDRLAQVFTNLVDNAIKHTGAGGSMRIRVKQEFDQVAVSVMDTGVGISDEELSRIFERFYQVERSRSGGDKRGTGLGLAIAHEIVEAHDGTIEVRSQEGQGSVFVVKLPLARNDDTTLATMHRKA